MYDRDEAVPVDTDHFEKELKRKQVMGKMLWSELPYEVLLLSEHNVKRNPTWFWPHIKPKSNP